MRKSVFEPPRIIDIATLTGTVAYALAGQYAGIFGNDKKLIAALTESGAECGELFVGTAAER